MQTELVRKGFNIRLSEEELARLEAVAAHYGLTVAGTIRLLVKREADAIAAAAPPAPPSKPARAPKKR